MKASMDEKFNRFSVGILASRDGGFPSILIRFPVDFPALSGRILRVRSELRRTANDALEEI